MWPRSGCESGCTHAGTIIMVMGEDHQFHVLTEQRNFRCKPERPPSPSVFQCPVTQKSLITSCRRFVKHVSRPHVRAPVLGLENASKRVICGDADRNLVPYGATSNTGLDVAATLGHTPPHARRAPVCVTSPPPRSRHPPPSSPVRFSGTSDDNISPCVTPYDQLCCNHRTNPRMLQRDSPFD
jgi:hypothetical protein